MIMKLRILQSLVFGPAFLLGCMLSLDNRLSIWPAIPEIDFKEETKQICALIGEQPDGGPWCICYEVEE